MVRISTAAANQSALADLVRAQREVFIAQKQLTTGKKADDLKGIGHLAESLSASRNAIDRAEAYAEAATRIEARLEVQDAAMNRVADAIAELRIALTEGRGDYIMMQAKQAYDEIAAALSAKHAGSFIFGGTRSTTDPVTINGFEDLPGLATAADAFQNSDRRQNVQLDENIFEEVGQLADEFGGEIMGILKSIADFDAGASGPFSDPPSAAQRAFFTTTLQSTITALDNVYIDIAENGALQRRVETTRIEHEERINLMKRLIGNLQDVDMAEAATRFQQAQTALDVSAKTFSTLSEVSLLPFLR